MTRPRAVTSSTFILGLLAATAGLGPSAAAANPPSTAECVAAADSSIQLRDQHKLREARGQMLVCAAASCPAAIQSQCLRRVDQVNAAIPTVVFEAKDPAGNDQSNIRVDMDGQLLTDRLDGSAVPIDPGEHHFRFTAPGGIVVDKTIVIRESEKDRHERVVIGAPSAAPPPGVLAAPPGATAPAPAASSENPGASRRTIAYVVGGVGVAGLALGTIFGIMASSASSNSKNECPQTGTCTDYNKSLSDYNTASTDATISTVGIIAGAAALGAGVILFVTAPSASSSTTGSPKPVWQFSPAVGSTGLGLTLKGAL